MDVNDLDDLGIVLDGHRLLYGWKHGHLRGSPRWMSRMIVTVWNRIACFLFGHSFLDPLVDREEFLPSSGVQAIVFKPRIEVCLYCRKKSSVRLKTKKMKTVVNTVTK